jgi:hypothetical protein
MTAYDRQIAGALRSIAAKGEICLWEKPADADPAAQPWREVREGEPPDPIQCTIAWFPPDQQQMKFAQDNGGIPEGFEIGLMGAVEFEPLVGERILRSRGDSVVLWKREQLSPDGEPILHTLWIKR